MRYNTIDNTSQIVILIHCWKKINLGHTSVYMTTLLIKKIKSLTLTILPACGHFTLIMFSKKEINMELCEREQLSLHCQLWVAAGVAKTGQFPASGIYFLIKDYQQPTACWKPQSVFGQSENPLSLLFAPEISQCHALLKSGFSLRIDRELTSLSIEAHDHKTHCSCASRGDLIRKSVILRW